MENVAGIANRSLNVMGDHQDGDALLSVQRFDQMVHLRSHLWVKSGNRLVQKQHFPGSTEGARQKDALLLTAGKLPVAAFCQRFDLHFAHGILRKLLFFTTVKRTQTAAALAARQHDLLHRRRKISLPDGLLGQIADLVLAQTIAHLDLPGNGLLQTEQRFHQGAFARTVFSDHAKIVPCVDLKVQRIQNGLSLIANEKVLTNELRHDGSFL